MKNDNPLTKKDMELIHEITCVFSTYQTLLVPRLRNKKHRKQWRDGKVDGGHKLIGKIFNELSSCICKEEKQGTWFCPKHGHIHKPYSCPKCGRDGTDGFHCTTVGKVHLPDEKPTKPLKNKRRVHVKHRIRITTEDEKFARRIYETIDKYLPTDKVATAKSTCVICGGSLSMTVEVFKGQKTFAYKCSKCGELYLDPLATERVLQSHKVKSKKSKIVSHADKLIQWEYFKKGDKGVFNVSKNVDAGDMMVVIKGLARKFNINLNVLGDAVANT